MKNATNGARTLKVAANLAKRFVVGDSPKTGGGNSFITIPILICRSPQNFQLDLFHQPDAISRRLLLSRIILQRRRRDIFVAHIGKFEKLRQERHIPISFLTELCFMDCRNYKYFAPTTLWAFAVNFIPSPSLAASARTNSRRPTDADARRAVCPSTPCHVPPFW